MTDPIPTIAQQLEQMKARGELDVRPEPRCNICKDEQMRTLVNGLLVRGWKIADILKVIGPANGAREHPLDYDAIYNHRRKHFDVQQPLEAIYRIILEDRAKEVGQDYEQGVGVAVNYLSYLDTVMVRAYENLVDPNTTVTVKEGMDAAVKIHDLTSKDDDAQQHALMMAEMSRVITAVREVCTPQQWEQMRAKLDGQTELPMIESQVSDDSLGDE